MRTLVLLVLAVGTLLAGCIAPPGDETSTALRSGGGSMSAKESSEESVALCREGLSLTQQFCAERVVTIQGDLSGVGMMDVDLTTFNGDVDVLEGEEGGWSLVAVLRARGASEADARANLDRIKFTWSHTDGASHFLRAKAETPPGANDLAAALTAKLPRSATLVVAAATSNGGITVQGVRTDGLAAHTSNGAVEVDAAVTQADLRTSNGAIDARLDPTGSGRITATTSNGQIKLVLPEDARHGYDLDAQTSNGRVTVNLRDGETTRKGPSNPYYDPQNDARFTTHGFASRDVQSLVRLVTSNGAITVDPR